MSPENNQQTREASSFSRNLSALHQEQRKRHDFLARDLFPKHLEIKELPDGYGFRFSERPLAFHSIIGVDHSGATLLSLPHA